MSDPPEIEVLLATYNGARFLRQQIDSILGQDYARVRVLARDDGSGDATPEILQDYAARYPARFRVMPSSKGTGSPKGNFLRLMEASTAGYISFADQDDVWLPTKLTDTKRAMDRLEARWGRRAALLVFTDLRVVDDELMPLHQSFWHRMGIDPTRIGRLAELLVRSVVTGCTALLNRPLLELALRMPPEALLHDRWIALLACTLGKSATLATPTVLYRQHDRNAVGMGANTMPGGLRRNGIFGLSRILRPGATAHAAAWEVSQRQAQAFLRVHGAELSAEQRDIVAAYLRCQSSTSRITRIATFLRYGFYYEGLIPNLLTVLYLSALKANDHDLR